MYPSLVVVEKDVAVLGVAETLELGRNVELKMADELYVILERAVLVFAHEEVMDVAKEKLVDSV